MVDHSSSSLFNSLFPLFTYLSILLNLPSHILHELVPNPLDLKMQLLTRISKLILAHPLFWRILGFVSGIVAFTCFALCPSFYDLFGRWNMLKIVIYSVISLILATLLLLIKKCTRFSRSVMVKAHVGFLVMMLTSLCSIWQDRVSQKESDQNGSRGRILNMCSFGAFGLMSLSLSRQLELGFEVGIFNFLSGSFLVLLMKMNFKLAPLAAFLCYVIINIRSLSHFFMEKLRRADTNDTELEDRENVPEHSQHKGISSDYAEMGFPPLKDYSEIFSYYLSQEDNERLLRAYQVAAYQMSSTKNTYQTYKSYFTYKIL